MRRAGAGGRRHRGHVGIGNGPPWIFGLMPGGPSERCWRHHGDDGMRFRGVCRGPAQIRAFGLLVRRDTAAGGGGPAPAGGPARRPRGRGAPPRAPPPPPPPPARAPPPPPPP